MPTGTTVQVPSALAPMAAEQTWQLPLHNSLQHFPSLQKPVEHERSPPVAKQVEPGRRTGAQAPVPPSDAVQ